MKIEQLFQAILIKTFQRGWKLSVSLVFCLERWGKSTVSACVSQHGVDTKTSVLPTGWKLLSYAKCSRETQQTTLYFHRPKYNKELLYRFEEASHVTHCNSISCLKCFCTFHLLCLGFASVLKDFTINGDHISVVFEAQRPVLNLALISPPSSVFA